MSETPTRARERRHGEMMREARAVLDQIERERRAPTPVESALISGLSTLSFEMRSPVGTATGPATAAAGMTPDGDPLPHRARGCRHRYSFLRALSSATANGRLGTPDGLEGEVNQEITRRLGRSTPGFYVPTDLELERRGLDTTTGTGAVPTIVTRRTFLDALRAKLTLAALGARLVDLAGVEGSSGKVQVPRKSAPTAVSWVGEGASPAAQSNMTIDDITFTPHSETAYTNLTRKMLRSATPDFEQWVLDDIARGLAIETDRVGLVGSGSGGEPVGLFAADLTPYPLGTDGGAIARADLVELERLIGNANADAAADAALGWCTTPNGRSKLRRTDGSTNGSGRWLWRDDDTVLGRPAYATSNIPSNYTKGAGTGLSGLAYGNWRDLIINTFGFIDFQINPYAFSATGFIILRAFLDLDVQLGHAESFKIVTDFTTT